MKYAQHMTFAALVISLLIAACSTVPETGRKQLSLVGSDELLQMSLSEFEKIKSSTPISRDAQQNALVQRVGKRIAAVADLPNAQWEFVVFDKPDVLNAFALPGGKVGVYSGLFKVTQNEAGLATVLGHEVAHATAKHGNERVSQALLLQLGGAALSEVTKAKPDTTQQILAMAYGVGTNVAIMLPHSRQQELEADHIGLLYMARAGYDPQESVRFWQRFAAQTRNQSKPPEFLSTHPLDSSRIERLRSLMPRAMQEYQKARR